MFIRKNRCLLSLALVLQLLNGCAEQKSPSMNTEWPKFEDTTSLDPVIASAINLYVVETKKWDRHLFRIRFQEMIGEFEKEDMKQGGIKDI